MMMLQLQLALAIILAFLSGAESFPASAHFTEEVHEAFTAENSEGLFQPAFMLVVPPGCDSAEICPLFVEFWEGIVQAYPGRTLVKECADGIREAPFCEPNLQFPFFVTWGEEGWGPYKGSTTFHAMHALVAEQLGGVVSPAQQWLKKYTFTNDLFTQNIPLMREHFEKFVDTPCKILEIGSFEGISACWIVDAVLSHPDATLITVDPFASSFLEGAYIRSTNGEAQRSTFLANVARSSFPSKVTSFVGTAKEYYYSSDVLKKDLETFDVILVDGAQDAANVLLDAVSCWSLLKPGGIMLVDDYRESMTRDMPAGTAKTAMEAFVTCHPTQLEVLSRDKAMVLRKKVPGEDDVADKWGDDEDEDDSWGIEGLDGLDFDGVADLFRDAAEELQSDGDSVDDGWGVEGMDDMASLFRDDAPGDDAEEDEDEDDDGGWGDEGMDDMASLFQEGAAEAHHGRRSGL